MTAVSRVFAAVLCIALPLGALSGCSSPVVSSPLDGTTWRLVGWSISSIHPGSVTITAGFAHGRISGNSGVNSYSGPYTVGPGRAFSVGTLTGTLIEGSEEAMRAEAAYLMLLEEARSYQRADDTLTLYDEGGNESLIFETSDK
ncbi:MAG: META domain-containing protein [Phycisphaerae bacterium]|nr:META domain-containing protein [Phycisphaerae bacterium]